MAKPTNVMKASDARLEVLYNGGLGLKGDTYDVKDQLKAWGFRWHEVRRTWIAPTRQALDLGLDLCRKAGIRVQPSPVSVPIPTDPNSALTAFVNPSRLADISNAELFAEVESRGFGVFELTRESLAEALEAAESEADFDFLEEP